MPRTLKFQKQYEPIGFGDPFNPRSVEGHHAELEKRRQARREKREAEEFRAVREAARPLHLKLVDRLRSRFGR